MNEGVSGLKSLQQLLDEFANSLELSSKNSGSALDFVPCPRARVLLVLMYRCSFGVSARRPGGPGSPTSDSASSFGSVSMDLSSVSHYPSVMRVCRSLTNVIR